MRALQAILLAAALVLTAAPPRADQNEAGLEPLFVQLKEAVDPGEAMPIEREIWRLWLKHPDRAVTILMQKGIAAMSRRDNLKALEIFDQMVKIAPEFAEAWNKRATVHYLLSQYDQSLDDIERTLELEPRHFGALSGRGLVYAEKRQPELALESFEAALEVHPQMIGARVNAEALRRDLGDREI